MIKKNPDQGVYFGSLGAELDALDIRKSNLILHSRLDAAYERWDDMFAKYAEAAAIDERLAEASRVAGFLERMRIHQSNGASYWAKAGNYIRAIEIADEMIADPALSEAYRASMVDLREKWKGERRTFFHALFADQADDETIAVTK